MKGVLLWMERAMIDDMERGEELESKGRKRDSFVMTMMVAEVTKVMIVQLRSMKKKMQEEGDCFQERRHNTAQGGAMQTSTRGANE